MKTWVNMALVLALTVWMGTFFTGCTVYDAARDERSIGTFADDKNITAKVKYRLLKDETVKGLDISVYCFLGKVYLIGAVEDSKQRQRSVEIARGVDGVKSIATYFLKKSDVTLGKTTDDTAITTKIMSKLIGDSRIKSTQIEVKTIMGHVILLGIVGNEEDKRIADQYARETKYVKKVKNLIIVK